MPRYRVRHRVTGEEYEVEAPYAQDACVQLGWMIGNCHVQIVRRGPFTDITTRPQETETKPNSN